jgi:hypothetical protein
MANSSDKFRNVEGISLVVKQIFVLSSSVRIWEILTHFVFVI